MRHIRPLFGSRNHGLEPEGKQVLQRGLQSWEVGLAGYLRAVSEVVGVLPGGTARDFDPPAAYLALSRKSPRHPGRDLLLVWSAADGWEVLLEHSEQRSAESLARFGDPLVPAPVSVAQFVDEVVTGERAGGSPSRGASGGLDELLRPYAVIALPPGSVRVCGPSPG
ncbi:DUF6292 family protein [Amycolatopsis sp. OK19-0408]|uniref:DUF6292 family protein n=1 Tax=Amycolatopsis iheyensis TaxID=2945988 RepID=A0A9X2NHL9_9PSEU|nr:DUF6292 family protein [Amycolatopsis iheyensis]MCR6488941.1 DUF6292 family protein [Amycolatopsis iheyensis]